MKKRTTLKLKLLVLFVILYSFIFIYQNRQTEKLINNELQNSIQKIQTTIKSSLYHFEMDTIRGEKGLAHNKRVQEIIALAAKVNAKEKKRLREELLEMMIEPYNRLKLIGAFQFHFVLPNNESFLRVHKPDRYGDDLTNIRETYNYVHKYKKPISGFENGKVLHGYRFVYPLFDQNNNYIGAFEISYAAKNIQDHLRDINKIHNHFIVKKDLFTKHEYLKDEINKKYMQSIEHKDFLFAPNDTHLTLEEDENHALNKHRKEIYKNIKDAKEFSLYTIVGNKAKTVHFIPIKNIKGKNCAYLVVYDHSPYIFNAIKYNNLISVVLFLFLVVLFIFVYFILNQKETLNELLDKKEVELLKSTDIINEFIHYSKTDIDGKITQLSDAFAKITGYSKEELIGKTHKIFRDPDFKNHPIYKEMWDQLSEGKSWRGKLKNRSKDGSVFWMDIFIAPEYDSDNKLKGYVAYRHDITNKKALEDLNRNLEDLVKEGIRKNSKQQELLLKQEKIVALGNMMDAIAHQWKQPLSVISMDIHNFVLDYELCEELKEEDYLNLEINVDQQVKHLVNTIDEFRSFFRVNKELKSVNVAKALESVVKLMKDTLNENQIDIDIVGDTNIEVPCIDTEFKHIFINLINNSKDAFNERDLENRIITIYLEEKDKEVIISVCDNAGGINEDIIPSIFEANFTTKNEDKGTGIGLYLTNQIVSKLHGIIKVENIQAGVCFRIVLSKNVEYK